MFISQNMIHEIIHIPHYHDVIALVAFAKHGSYGLILNQLAVLPPVFDNNPHETI